MKNPKMKNHFVLVVSLFLIFAQSTYGQSTAFLEEMTWPEIEAAIKNGTDTIIITIGATEQHGPQLALSSDSITGDYLAQQIARKVGRALIAPNIRVGISPHHMYFPGTISVRASVISQLTLEYVHSLVWHGFRHIVIIPTHGGNFSLVGEVGEKISRLYPYVNVLAFSDAEAYINSMTATSKRLGIDLQIAGSHAGMSETSMALASRPDLVRMDQAMPGFLGDAYGIGNKLNDEGTKSISEIGVLGDPRYASAESGLEYLKDLSDLLASFVTSGREGWRISPPQKIAYGGLPEPQGELAEGILARRAGDYSKARAFFSGVLERNPEDIEARIELGRTWILTGDYEKARIEMAQVADLNDPSAIERSNDQLALIDLYQGHSKKAIEHKQMALQAALSGNTQPEVGARKYLQLGYLQSQAGQFDAAAISYNKALELAPSVSAINLDIVHLAGLLEVRQGRLHKAADRLRIIGDAVFEEQFAAQIRRFYQLNAELLLQQGRAQDALIILPLAIQAYDHPLYRETLARAYLVVGRLKDAEEELLHLINLTDARLDIPNHFVKAHYQLGRLYQDTGRFEEARGMYSTFLSLWGESDTPVAEVALARNELAHLQSAQ